MILMILFDTTKPVENSDMSHDPLDDIELSEEYEDWEDEIYE